MEQGTLPNIAHRDNARESGSAKGRQLYTGHRPSTAGTRPSTAREAFLAKKKGANGLPMLVGPGDIGFPEPDTPQ